MSVEQLGQMTPGEMNAKGYRREYSLDEIFSEILTIDNIRYINDFQLAGAQAGGLDLINNGCVPSNDADPEWHEKMSKIQQNLTKLDRDTEEIAGNDPVIIYLLQFTGSSHKEMSNSYRARNTIISCVEVLKTLNLWHEERRQGIAV